MAILNKYKKKWKTSLLLRKDRYYDFVLSHDNTPSIDIDGKLTEKCLITYIDTNNPNCIIDNSLLFSNPKYSYEKAINDNVSLKNIGFTGIDTSIVPFDVSSGTTDDFIDIVLNTTLDVTSGDTRLQLIPVSGNTKLYDYPCEIVSENTGDTYYKMTGGFLQGFYKTCDKKYQVLPQYIDGTWGLEFVIRPRTDYVESRNTLNSVYPDNEGIFFYMGTRAENKFIEYYGCKDIDKYPLRVLSGTTENNSGETKNPVLVTTEGHTAESGLEYDINTDNGYLIYDRTCDGYTVDTWTRGDTLRLTLKKRDVKSNLYNVMNRTCTGHTVDTLEKYLEEHPEEYVNDKCNVLKDILNNAFALKINKNGSIGYKYLTRDCDNEKGFRITEENGFPNTIKTNEWNVIYVKCQIVNGESDNCDVPLGERKMKIYIYVNGRLKFISKELPEFNFKELNDYCDKQEGVAFNISLGGGTQGLMESLWFNKMTGSKHIFPIEENFAGSFIGDIRSFKFYDCELEFNEIKNNYLFESIEK